jgi:Carboxypeptidase regulatory-like domain/TonB dependent receptor
LNQLDNGLSQAYLFGIHRLQLWIFTPNQAAVKPRQSAFLWHVIRYSLLLVLFGIIASTTCHSQSTTGSFLGRITDPSGAVIPGAAVVLTNEDTGISQHQTSNHEGDYSFNSIQPGRYRIEITQSGFKTLVLDNVNLDVQQSLRKDVSLSTGSATASVTVNATSSLIQTDSFSVATVVDGSQIEETPLDGRESSATLQGLAAGVQRPSTNSLIAGSSFQGGANESVDGISINDILNARMSDSIPSLDAVAQFVVIANNPPAQYGNGGAQIILQTKSGTDTFHGTLFEFNRNRYFAARNYFLLPSQRNPPFNRNEYGGTIGGPIIRDKLFFFFSYEDGRSITTNTNQFEMPISSFIKGDFSQYKTVVVNGQTLNSIVYDPLTGLPFPDNKIPASRISAAGARFAQFYSTPNIVTPTGLGNNFSYSSPSYQVDPRWEIRIDYQAGSKDHLMFRYYPNHNSTSPSTVNGTDKFGNYFLVGNYLNNYGANYTRIITPNIVNELDFGVYKFASPRLDQNYNFDPASVVPGLPPSPPGFGTVPTISVSDYTTINHQSSNANANQHAIQIYDNATLARGTHNIKFGGQYLADYESTTNYNSGSFSFNGTYSGQYTNPKISGNPLTKQGTNPVNSIADLLLGYITSDTTYNGSASFAASLNSYGLYVQDTWNASPRLTLSYGLRYDKLFPFHMDQGGLANFDPSTGKMYAITGTPDPTISSLYPFTPGSDVGLNNNNWIHMQSLNFAPRLGFAYRPGRSDRYVIRGGYGIIYDNLSFAYIINNEANQFPFVLNNTYTSPSALTPSLTFSDPFPTTGASQGNPSLTAVNKNYKTPYNENWNISVEAMVTQNTAVRASYLGNLGTHLFMPYGLNDYIPQPVGGTGNPVNTQAIRPYQPWGSITYYSGGESTNVEQFQLSAIRRFAGLTFNIQYQHTKALGLDGPNNELVTDRSDIRYDYGNLDYYAQNFISTQYSYILPIGTGQMVLPHVGSAVNNIVSGWRLTGTILAGDGEPFSVDYTPTLSGSLGTRASRVPGVSLYPKHKSISEWYNAAAFENPAPYTFGNEQRNSVYDPGTFTWNAAVFKNFVITERIGFEFRTESFNVLNHTNFAGIGGAAQTFSSTSAGTITSANSGRTLQFGGRLSF